MKINMTDKYKTKSGDPVEIKFVDGKGDFPVVGYIGDSLEIWTSEGWYTSSGISKSALVKVEAWEELQIDDIVMVDFGCNYLPRHYAGNGECFKDGCSSMTTNGRDNIQLSSYAWKLPEVNS